MSELVIPHDEACRELECSEVKLKQLIACGDIPAVQPGKAYVIPRQAFYEAVNELAKREAEKRRAALTGQVSAGTTSTASQQPLPKRRGPRQSAAGWLATQLRP